jgi:hypothetical protein
MTLSCKRTHQPLKKSIEKLKHGLFVSLHSQLTLMVRVDVTSFPYPFLAVHVNCPASSHLALSKPEVKGEGPDPGTVARGPVMMMLDGGLPPVARQVKVTLSLSLTVTLFPVCDVTVKSALLGGSETEHVTQTSVSGNNWRNGSYIKIKRPPSRIPRTNFTKGSISVFLEQKTHSQLEMCRSADSLSSLWTR